MPFLPHNPPNLSWLGTGQHSPHFLIPLAVRRNHTCQALSGTVYTHRNNNPPKYFNFDQILKFVASVPPPLNTDQGQIWHTVRWAKYVFHIQELVFWLPQPLVYVSKLNFTWVGLFFHPRKVKNVSKYRYFDKCVILKGPCAYTLSPIGAKFGLLE